MISDLKRTQQERNKLNSQLAELDGFFESISRLDSDAYSDGAIPKKYKELTGLVISVLSKCDECIAYHLAECREAGCSKEEVVDALKIAVIGGGSITYPWARIAVALLEEMKFKES